MAQAIGAHPHSDARDLGSTTDDEWSDVCSTLVILGQDGFARPITVLEKGQVRRFGKVCAYLANYSGTRDPPPSQALYSTAQSCEWVRIRVGSQLAVSQPSEHARRAQL